MGSLARRGCRGPGLFLCGVITDERDSEDAQQLHVDKISACQRQYLVLCSNKQVWTVFLIVLRSVTIRACSFISVGSIDCRRDARVVGVSFRSGFRVLLSFSVVACACRSY